MKNEAKSKLSRRHFLIAVGAGGAAAAAAVASRAVTTEEPQAVANKDKRRGRGYQESAHVRTYYNTAKV
jgi:shikimate 5-dehydrogenase